MNPIQAAYQKICPTCLTGFEARRTNQKYCSPKCKTRLNNARARTDKLDMAERRKVTRAHADIHWRNRNLLARYVDQEVTQAELRAKGFQPSLVTAFRIVEKKTIFFMHDYCFQVVTKGKFRIWYSPEAEDL